ncbi:MAG: hypothetical protein Q8O30_13380 [Candidatus Omnitrophota bacterium]|nr:hypothetical protein [Candidatus Omnitrophota bacterium]
MNLLLKIANIKILIKDGKSFLKLLSPVETTLLRSFIISESVRGSVKKRFFSVTIKYVPASKQPITFQRPDYKRIEIFFSPFDKRCKEYINSLAKKNLYSILKNINIKPDLAMHHVGYNKIIITHYAFLIFNYKSYSCSIYYADPSDLHIKRTYIIDTLKLLMRLILNSKRNGVLIHASSMEYKGKGYVFIGRGRSGKSTIIKMLNSDRVLSDDATIILNVNGDYRVYSTPWWNEDADLEVQKPIIPSSLKAIFFIKKSNKIKIQRLNYKESLFSFIYKDAEFQQAGFIDNKTGIKNYYLFIQRLICHVPVFKFEVKKIPRVQEEFDKLIDNYFKNEKNK